MLIGGKIFVPMPSNRDDDNRKTEWRDVAIIGIGAVVGAAFWIAIAIALRYLLG